VTLVEGEQVEVVAGRMYTFPKGMSCTWEVHTRTHARARARARTHTHTHSRREIV